MFETAMLIGSTRSGSEILVASICSRGKSRPPTITVETGPMHGGARGQRLAKCEESWQAPCFGRARRASRREPSPLIPKATRYRTCDKN